MKKLVIFYSFEGNTRLIANAIAKAVKADVLELKPKKDLKHKKGFLKYFWGGKMVVHKEKPELLRSSKDPENYGMIFIGTPVWAFTYTPAMNSFLSSQKLSGKRIALFCCHGGSKGNTLENMQAKLKGNKLIGKADFIEPSRSRKESARKAESWARKVINSMR